MRTRPLLRSLTAVSCFVCSMLFPVQRLARAQEQAPHQFTEAENYGLKGPVHIVVTTSKVLAPAVELGLAPPAAAVMGWMEFDSHGSLIAHASDASEGETAPRAVREYDAQGRLTARGDWADGQTMIRQEYIYGPYGPVEVRWYSGKTLYARTTVEYDKNGNFTRDASYDVDGNLTHESLQRQDARLNLVEQEGRDANGVSSVHVTDRVDDKTGILEHQSIDANGHVVGILQIRDGELVSWWQAPDYSCAEGQSEEGLFNWNSEPQRRQVWFTLRCPHTLEITRLHHAGKSGNIEQDLIERTLEDGTALERVECQYDRDAHDNWTKMAVLKLDLAKNIMVPIREDRRTITYYGEQKQPEAAHP